MSVRYHCPHLSEEAPLPSSHASSSTSFTPLDSLYFCEECDALRCNTCVAVEIAGYLCPSCLFDVPSANVRADKNRCARHCILCPRCSTFTEVQGTTTADGGPVGQGPPYVLVCKGCRWTSREAGLEFEKNTGIATQLQQQLAAKDSAQAEYDALKDHIQDHISASSTSAATTTSTTPRKRPTRHISHLTQMAARALNKSKGDVKREEKGPLPWDEMGQYGSKVDWRSVSLREVSPVDNAGNGVGEMDQWRNSWYGEGRPLPERVPLLAKYTKRCPHSDCRHLLIQPDTKSTRYKIKMVAANYIPQIEVGRRRRRLNANTLDESAIAVGDVVHAPVDEAEIERRRKERRRTRREEVDEPIDSPLQPGQVYTFQLAFTNSTLDAVQIRLTSLNKNLVHCYTPHFTVSAPKDAWAYDEDELELGGDDGGGTEITSEDGSVMTRGTSAAAASAAGTISKKSRMSILSGAAAAAAGSGSGSVRDKDRDRKKREPEVEKKGNCTKVVVELEVPLNAIPNAEHQQQQQEGSGTGTGNLDADFEVRLTYRVEGEDREEYKNFTFWVRVGFGVVE